MTYYYPKITRREEYKKTKQHKYYADYHEYHSEITEDCKQRCVYCDIHLNEMGGEGMQLDHFRPQKHFSELKSDPRNLVLSCPKCNVLKKDHWPCDLNEDITFDGDKGFVDPFEVDRTQFFSVKECGELSSLQHPSDYMITLLQLNRQARILMRRRRAMTYKVKEMSDLLVKEIEISKDNSLDREVRIKAYDRVSILASALQKIHTSQIV